MITPAEALEIIERNTVVTGESLINTNEGLNRVLRKDIAATMDLPQFDQSAMDGFAMRFEDYTNGVPMKLIGESSAGKPFSGNAGKGEIIRIFTGAEVPEWANHIAIVEHAVVNGDNVTFNDPNVKAGQHIRTKGSQIRKGEIAVTAGTILNAATVGFLYSLGYNTVPVNSKIRVALIITGNELKQPGETLTEGQIYESNSVMLSAAIEQQTRHMPDILFCRDDENEMTALVKEVLSKYDLILVSGGISAGDYDFTAPSLMKNGVTKHFHKIAQKPGKPIFYGTKDRVQVFGLPGNPASALICYYEYVYPCLNKMRGGEFKSLPKVQMQLGADYRKKPGLQHFLKGTIRNGKVYPMSGQESFILKSLSESDCLIVIPAETDVISTDAFVEVHVLPF
jgi:molybdopterin molybdotransferase